MGSRFRVRGRTLGLVLASFALLASSVPAMGQDPDPSPSVQFTAPGPDTGVHHVGVTSDPDVYIAVVVDGADVSVYLCDGADLGVWMVGELTDGVATVTGADGSSADVSVADGEASGTVTLADGTSLTFSAPMALLPAGLFEVTRVENGEPVQARTIVLPDGTAKGRKKPYDCADAKGTFDVLINNAFKAPFGSAAQEEWLADADSLYGAASRAGCAWANT